ncbi:MAG: hypothetical protein PHC50_04485 [Candidatus Cloacimonetes bacterium]|nr:hypothetical protein [Candidatus Cloacimonadota bacterium]
MPKAEYDKQGKYFWHLVKLAGWTEERVDKLILKKYQATHWNALSVREKSTMVAIMKRYAEKEETNRLKRMRQGLMAMVARRGYNLDWLHERMVEWGYGESLRALSATRINALNMDIRKAIGE